MDFDALRHHRHTVRRQGSGEGPGNFCPYSVGVFYVTICTHRRECLFGEVVEGVMRLNPWGAVVKQEWENVPEHRPSVTMDFLVVMPNHMHGIIIIRETARAGVEPQFAKPVAGSLGMVIGGFKSAVSRHINRLRDTPGAPVWQKNYHDRVVRDDRMLQSARRYIANNPANWPQDVNRPADPTL